ncbi:formin-like protein 11 [Ipomoea triloba]|uniref:formin-like protein 11 n=1 Tax=Ipomoea triloba TaxID=35885 RepID=UPI00125D3753|nr:formin-like protein 11 [Ipomoea triloba]
MGGHGSQILPMAFFVVIITFFLVSFYSTRILTAGCFTLNDQRRVHNLDENENGNRRVIVLEKLRALLGMKDGFELREPNNAAADDSTVYSSPSPSPLPSPSPAPGIEGEEAPAPSPRRAVHRHSHHHRPSLPQAHKAKQKKKKEEGEGSSRKVLTAVLVSAGVTFSLCAVCLFWGCRRFQNKKKKTVRTIYCRSKYLSSQMSSVKPDLFYLDSVGIGLETPCPGPLFPEHGSDTETSLSTQIITPNGRQETDPQVHKPGDDNGEIIVFDEPHSPSSSSDDDDDSFHSICNPGSIRLSNASAGSLTEETSQDDSKLSFPVLNSEPYCPSTSVPPPPPPPPPPPRPCLPPFAKGGPPPPPSPPPPPAGKDGSPLPRLKPLHWDKVRAAPNRSTVWDQLKPSSFEFDEEMIESLFGYNLQNSMNDEAKSKTPSPTKHVLEPKRLQNITILSKALNVSANQVCEALTKGKGLSLRELEALAKMMPNKEEEAKLANYKGDINELGSAEKFVKAILKVPFAFKRVEAMLYQETFSDEVLHLRKSFSMLEEACKELRSSRLFLKLLEAVLKTGNRMNVGTVRGGARAFKLDALLKLADVKGTDGKTTLLHFVVQEIVRSEGLKFSESIMGKIEQRTKPKKPENDREENYRQMGLDLVSGLSTELCNVKKTATIDLDVLANSVSNLSAGIANIRSLVAMEDRIVDGFVGSMRSFLNGAERALKELREDENGVLLRVREITEYFHGDVSKDEPNPLRIFVIVRDFLGMLDHVCKQLRNSKPLSSPSPLSPFR